MNSLFKCGHMTLLVFVSLLTFQAPANALAPIEAAKLLPSDGAANDDLGYAVAIDGDTAVIGAPGDANAGFDSGSAYVFVRDASGVWHEQGLLIAHDATSADRFGSSVAISGDTVIIGSSEDDDAGTWTGSAYIFTRIGSSWVQEAKLTPSDAASGDFSGFSVAVAGETVVIGAYGGDGTISNSGSASVFVRNAGNWIEQAKLIASDAAQDDRFGIAVAISGDTVIVGAYFNDDAGSASGSAYVFVRDAGNWIEQAKLTASDAAQDDRFGFSVAISSDTAVVGAHMNDDGGSASGSAYVYNRFDTTWVQEVKLTASDAAASDLFGFEVAVAGDTAVIGAFGNDDAGSRSGSAYIFTGSSGNWSEVEKLTASDAARGHRYGFSVAVAGNTAIIGSSEDDEAGFRSGSAYVIALTKDGDHDGVVDQEDNCPYTKNPGQENGDGDALGDACDDDDDNDGLLDVVDLCPETDIPEQTIPRRYLGVNRWALMEDTGNFVTYHPRGKQHSQVFTVSDTGGCSCEQIVDAQSLGEVYRDFGCSYSVMENWVNSIQR